MSQRNVVIALLIVAIVLICLIADAALHGPTAEGEPLTIAVEISTGVELKSEVEADSADVDADSGAPADSASE